jgi:YHS domain-containing protein
MFPVRLLAHGALLAGIAVAAGSSWAASAGEEAEPRLALKGYDPIAYFTMGGPVLGKPDFHHDVDEVRYHFATPEHLALFQEDPDRYAPRYTGLCTMGLAAKGYRVEATPENWVIHEGRLYVTQRSFGPGGFRQDPERWVVAAEENLEALGDAPIGSGLSWW